MDEQQLRKQAVKQIKKKRNFQRMLFGYVVINAFLIVIWAVSGQGFFWPAFVLAGWGIGVLFSAWDAYGKGRNISESDINAEMQKLK